MVPKEILKKLYNYANTLINQQKSNGAWYQKKPSLQSVVLTCQISLLLVLFFGKKIKKSLEKASSWLTSTKVVTNEYSYWRALPLIEIGCNDTEIEDALNHVKQKIVSGVLHHENSPIKEFYCSCVYKANKSCKVANNITRELKDIVHNNDIIRKLPSNKISHILSYLYATGNIEEKEVSMLLDIIISKSEISDGMRKWTSLVSTSYVVLNLIEILKVCQCQKLQNKINKLVEEAGRYLIKRWADDNFKSPPTAGGDFDDTDFSKIVSARALVNIALYNNPRCFESIITDRSDDLKFLNTLLVMILLGVLLISLNKYIIKSLSYFNFTVKASFWKTIGRLADLVGISPIIYSVVLFVKEMVINRVLK